MSLPGIFSPAEPQASETVASGPAKIQANNQALSDFLGIPVSPTQLVAPAFSMTAGGVVTISQSGATVAADPTANLGIATKQYVDGKAVGIPTGVASGTNTYAVTLTPAPANLAALVGQPVYVQFSNGNTGAATLNPNGLGAVGITLNGSALTTGKIIGGQYYSLVYDSTNFEIIGAVPSTGGGYASQNISSGLASHTAFTNLTGTLALTAPSAGGPFRLVISYFVFATNAGAPSSVDFRATDGTNFWAYSNIFMPFSTLPGGSGVSTDISPTTYASGAVVSINVQAWATNTSPMATLGGTTTVGSLQSYVKGWFVPSN